MYIALLKQGKQIEISKKQYRRRPSAITGKGV